MKFLCALPKLSANKIRAIAVTTAQRVPALPDVPTLIKQGYDMDVVTWYTVIVPAGTPKAITARLYWEYTAVAQLPEVQKFLADQGLVYLPNAPGQFAQRSDAESARCAQIIKEQNIRVEQGSCTTCSGSITGKRAWGATPGSWQPRSARMSGCGTIACPIADP